MTCTPWTTWTTSNFWQVHSLITDFFDNKRATSNVNKINLSELYFLQRLLNTYPWPWGLGTSFAAHLSIGGCHWFAQCSWKLHGGSAAANFWLMTGSVTRSGSTTFRFPFQSSTSFTWKPFMTSLTYTYGYHTGTVSNWIWCDIPLWCSHGVAHVLLMLNANFRELTLKKGSFTTYKTFW